MYEFEHELLNRGLKYICGVDEAGRGPLAGPVFAGAVILDPEFVIEGLDDSKKLTHQKRLELTKQIKCHALAFGISQVCETEIDRINIYQASKLAMLKAIALCNIKPDFILTDAMPLKEIDIPSLPIIKGDQLSASIAAASILAKTARDEYMVKLGELYPGYGLEIHKGYPTKMHIEAIEKFGVLPIHRKTYKPIKNRLKQQMTLDFGAMTDE